MNLTPEQRAEKALEVCRELHKLKDDHATIGTIFGSRLEKIVELASQVTAKEPHWLAEAAALKWFEPKETPKLLHEIISETTRIGEFRELLEQLHIINGRPNDALGERVEKLLEETKEPSP